MNEFALTHCIRVDAFGATEFETLNRLCESSAMVKFGLPQRVYVENEWYDGPRAGVADINGLPHRFKSLFDEKEDQYLGTFIVWPIDKLELERELEQWWIFVQWKTLYETGKADTQSHPGQGGINARWDELEVLLQPSRAAATTKQKRANAEMIPIDREPRYAESGPAYALSWAIL